MGYNTIPEWGHTDEFNKVIQGLVGVKIKKPPPTTQNSTVNGDLVIVRLPGKNGKFIMKIVLTFKSRICT